MWNPIIYIYILYLRSLFYMYNSRVLSPRSTINLRLSVAIVFSGQQPRRVKAKLQPVREHKLYVQPSRGTSAMYLGTAALKLTCQSDPLCGRVLQKPVAARGGCDGRPINNMHRCRLIVRLWLYSCHRTSLYDGELN